jgi:hypothetical protein
MLLGMSELEQACRSFLPSPLEPTTFGDAFKGFLRFRQEYPVEWAKADDIMVGIELEYDEPERMGGLLGMFGMTKPEQPKSVLVTLDRVLDTIPNDAEDMDEDTDGRSEAVTLEFEYDIAVAQGLNFDEIEYNFYDSCEHETLEEFVQAVLEDELLKKVALLRPKRIEFVTEDE